MKSVIVKEGSAANGDGHDGYAARRRNLACRPLALGRHHGAHESLPTSRRLISLPDHGGPTDQDHTSFIAQESCNPHDRCAMPSTKLDCQRES
jgi:hypothetical protein